MKPITRSDRSAEGGSGRGASKLGQCDRQSQNGFPFVAVIVYPTPRYYSRYSPQVGTRTNCPLIAAKFVDK